MLCPIDQTELVMSDRQGVEIDYCPTCRGVWLDRGELDKIIDRASDPAPSRPAPRDSRVAATPDERERTTGGFLGKARDTFADRDDDDDRRHAGQPRKKKRGSFLEELFDF